MPREEIVTITEEVRLSLADQLRIKKSNIAKKASAECAKLSRQIQLLDQTGSESIVRKAEELLAE